VKELTYVFSARTACRPSGRYGLVAGMTQSGAVAEQGVQASDAAHKKKARAALGGPGLVQA